MLASRGRAVPPGKSVTIPTILENYRIDLILQPIVPLGLFS